MPRKYVYFGVLIVLAGLVIGFGYAPAMRAWYTHQLETAPAAEDRIAAAEALYESHDFAAFRIFSEHLGSTDSLTRRGAARGMELFGKEGGSNGTDALNEFEAVLSKADTAGAIVYIHSLSAIGQALGEKQSAPAENKSIFNSAAGLIVPFVDARAHPDMPLRLAAVEALSALRSPRVCRALLKVATEDENKDLKEKARQNLYATALPDAAGELVKTISSADKELAAEAKRAFLRVRGEARSDELLPFVNDPSDDVRREIVGALGQRKGDSVAATGITAALKDKLPEIRALAVKSIPITGLSGSASQLAALIDDSDESVRIANAETLAALSDENSKKVVLESFGHKLEGKTQDAYVQALGRRFGGSTKDLKAISTVMDILQKNPASEGAAREALVLLTNAGQGPRRDAQRRAWSAEKWKAWYASFSERETLNAKAMEMLHGADKRRQGDKKYYPELLKITNDAFDLLDKCKEKCKPDDPEDEAAIDRTMFQYSKMKDLFFKHQSIDVLH